MMRSCAQLVAFATGLIPRLATSLVTLLASIKLGTQTHPSDWVSCDSP